MATALFTASTQNGNIYETKYVFTDSSSGDNISQIVWNFGDGTYVYNEKTFTKTYDYPGIYTVSLNVYDTNNQYSTTSVQITANSHVKDYVAFTRIPNRYNLIGRATDESFKIQVQCSQLVDTLNLQLYAANSKSIPYNQIDDKWSFLNPTWRFCKNHDGSDIIEVLSLSATPIYLNSKQVGVSAEGEFYYIDDTGTKDITEDCPILISATLKTSDFINPLDSNVYSYSSLSNNKIVKSSTTWRVIDDFPLFLKVTGNYIDEIYKEKWNNIKIPTMITLHSYGRDYFLYGDTSDTSSIIFGYPSNNELGKISEVVLSLSSSSGVTRIDSDDGSLYLSHNDSKGFRNGGYLFTSITSTSAFSTVSIVASTTIYNSNTAEQESFQFPYHYNPNQFVYVPVPDVGMIGKILYTPQSANEGCLSVDYRESGTLIEGRVDKFYVPLSTNTSTVNYATSSSTGMYGVAIDPRDYSLIGLDAEQDKIYRISSEGVVLSTLDLSYLFGTSNPEVSGLTPSYVSLDGDFNIWVSLVNGLSVLKFDKDFNLQFAIPLTNSGVIDGDYYMKPTVVETDRDNNVWVTYSNQLSSTLSKYTSGGALSLNISIPVSSSPINVSVDKNNDIWVTERFTDNNYSGQINKYDGSTGQLLSSVSNFPKPAYIALDRSNNVWFTFGVRSFGYIDRVTSALSAWTFSEISDVTNLRIISLSTTSFIETSACDEELGGLAIDVYDRVWIIDSLTNNAYIFNASPDFDFTDVSYINIKQRPNISFYIDGDDTFSTPLCSIYYKSAAATGDWTGNVWYQKYAIDTLDTVDVVGVSEPFTINDFDSYYNIRKVNDSFNTAKYMKSVAFPELLYNNPKLFDEFLPAVVGDGSENFKLFDDIGRESYEKIANFNINTTNIDTCDINFLKSLAVQIGQEPFNYGVEFPSDVSRMLNLASICRQRLWGETLSGVDINNIIDWNSEYTTLDKSLSADWDKEDGLIEKFFNHILTENLFSQ